MPQEREGRHVAASLDLTGVCMASINSHFAFFRVLLCKMQPPATASAVLIQSASEFLIAVEGEHDDSR